MTTKIEQFALDSGLAYKRSDGKYWIDAGYIDTHLEQYTELVRQDERNLQRTKKEWSDHDRAIAASEREAIEKIVKRLRPEIVGAPNDSDSHQQWCDSAAAFSRFESVIAAIRARSKHD